MVSPCSLILQMEKPDSETVLKLYTSDELETLSDADIVEIREYQAFTILLKSENSDAYFCIPEVDDYDIPQRISNEAISDELIYLPNVRYKIFGFSQGRNPEIIQTVPLTPGYYTIRLYTNDQWFFAYWRIIPKDLSQEEWQAIRDDVEAKVRGLAMDYTTRKRTQVRRLRGGKFELYLDDDTTFLIAQSSRIRFAVEKLRNEAKFRISKRYSWVPSGSSNDTDQLTIRKIGERPDKQNQLYSPIRYLEYNIAINQWLKLIINTITKTCESQSAYLASVQAELDIQYAEEERFKGNRTDSEIAFTKNSYESTHSQIVSNMQALLKLSRYLSIVLQDEFLASVDLPANRIFPKGLMLNPQYNLLYKIYYGLRHQDKHYTTDAYYSRYWKKTAKLYEIWTYIKVLDSLINSGYRPISGWIYDSATVLPFLDDETTVILKGDDVTLQLAFNQAIPHDEKKVTKQMPLMIYARKNKPDIRLDIFIKEDLYLGSIILDAKYKNLKALMRERNEGFAGVAEQFRAYRNDPDSPLLHIPQAIKPKPVDAVIVLYPDKPDKEEAIINRQNSVTYMQLKPGVGDSNLSRILEQHITNVFGRSNYLETL